MLRANCLLALSLLVWACSDDGGSPVDLAARDGLDSGRGDTIRDGGRTAACAAQDTKLQAALDAARKSPNAILVVRNSGCGTSVYVSGSSSTGNAASLWRIGSVTKTYVAAAILTFVREAKLSLSDPLSKWVPNVPGTDGVTVKMLLNHTSGIFNYTEDKTWTKDLQKVWTPAEIVALAASHTHYFAPGTSWHYSKTNYVLLGMILEKAGAAKASAVIRKRTLEPAGLSHTFLEGEETLQGKLATGFDQNKTDITHAYSMSGPWTAGAMAASGADICDWVHALYAGEKVLSVGERKTMVEQPVNAGSSMKYGLGVMILDASITAGAGQAVGHGGSIHGFHTQAFWFPEKQTAICAVVNQDGASPNDVTLAALKALFGA